MTTYESLVARHENLQQQIADDPDSVGVDNARQFIEETRAVGREVAEIPQRQQLRAILRYWGHLIHERTGDYPNTHLLPYSDGAPATTGEPPSPAARGQTRQTTADGKTATSALVPVLGQRVSRTTAERPAWFWPLLGLVFVAAIVLALLTPAIWSRLTNADSVDPEVVAFASPTVGMPTVLGDSDADGLSDEQEALLGTENTRADTDGDGLLDGEEVLVYGSNPAAADSDGDGVPDGAEVAAGTLPTDPGSVSPLAPSPVADPAPGITVTEAMTVTVTPTLPSGPILIVAPAEGQMAVPIRTGPGERYGVVIDVPGGTAVLMVRRVPDNSWYSIELAGGARGWLPAAQTIVPETTNIAAVPTFVPPQQ